MTLRVDLEAQPAPGCDEEVCRYCLGRHPAAGGALSQAETDLIHRYRARRRLRAHERLCAAGRAPPFFIGNIIEGVVKLSFAADPDAVDALLFPGDFLGPFGDAGPTCTAAALTDCELCCFQSAGLHRVFDRHPRLRENFMQHFAHAVERAREDAAKLRRPQAAARVAALLNIFAARAAASAGDGDDGGDGDGDRGGDGVGGGGGGGDGVGGGVGGGGGGGGDGGGDRGGVGGGVGGDGVGGDGDVRNRGLEIELPLRRSEMGLLLGLSPETVSRALSRLRQAGVIRPVSRRAWLIKAPAKLAALAED